jgi:O-6-methylguanine DNA methyltransferase
MIYIKQIPTPIGDMVLTAGNTVLLEKYAQTLTRYFHGKKIQIFFDDYGIDGTPFEKKVLRTLCTIPYGQTISYKDLAHKSGYPNAVRAVANVVAKNKFYIIIPCHRVIHSDGRIGNYGAGGERKKWLLHHEGIVV